MQSASKGLLKMIDSSIWTGLKEKILPHTPVSPLESETLYVAVNYNRDPVYISSDCYWYARDARRAMAEIFYPNDEWHQGWKRAKVDGWRIRRAKVILEPGQ